jgi:small subunit ribosomal protein S20
MPNTKSAKKALKQDQVRQKENLRKKRNFKELFKEIQRLSLAGKKDEIQELLPKYDKAVDKAAKTNIIEPNTAARKKSRIRRFLKN